MKVLHVINSLAAGGAEKLVVEIANYLAENNINTSVFTFQSKNNFFVNGLSDKVKYKANKTGSFFSIMNFISLVKLIKKHDVIHVHLFPSFYIVGLLALFFSNKKFIYTEHNTYNRRRNWKYKFIEHFMYSKYTYITCISKGSKSNLVSWIGNQQKIKLIYNFVNLDALFNAKKYTKIELGFNEADKLIVMVGSFSGNQKDQKTLINTLFLLPKHFKLLLIGDGDLRGKNEEFVLNSGLINRVHFLGNRADVYNILKACDYGVLSSNWEGFGLVALEYMACGLPSLGSNVEGLNEIIADKNCLFEVGDSKKIAHILLSIDNDNKKRENIIRIQNNKLNQYDIKEIMRETIKLYKL